MALYNMLDFCAVSRCVPTPIYIPTQSIPPSLPRDPLWTAQGSTAAAGAHRGLSVPPRALRAAPGPTAAAVAD